MVNDIATQLLVVRRQLPMAIAANAHAATGRFF